MGRSTKNLLWSFLLTIGSLLPATRAVPETPAAPEPIPALGCADRTIRAAADGVPSLFHPEHGLHARFAPESATLRTAGGGELSMRLERWGRREAMTPVVRRRRSVTTERVEYAMSGIREWWVSRAAGIEHGFTLATRRPGEGPLVLDVAVGGFSAAGRGDGLLLSDGDGERLRYTGLVVFDARGAVVPASMTGEGPRIRILVDDRDAVYPLVVDPLIVSEQAKLTAGDAGDELGGSVAISGDTIVAGARFDGTGTASVFVRSGTTWALQATLTASDPLGANQFGASVAIDGDTVVVGSPGGSSGSVFGGAAYVYVRTGTTWSEQQKLVASDAASGDQFGSGVAIDGETIVVGAPGADVGSEGGAGAAYAFVRSGATWSQQQKLTASDAAADDVLGVSVSISGDTVVAGAHQEDPGGSSNAGSAYVFVRSGVAWSEQQKLTAPAPAAFEQFGFATDVDGDTAIFGAAQGSFAYVFVRSGATWTFQQQIQSAAIPAGFHSAVAVQGDRALAGTPLAASAAGTVHFFTRSGASWTRVDSFSGSDTVAGDRFGTSVDLDADTIVAGAPRHDELGAEAGAAYVFLVEDVPAVSVGDATVTEGGPGDTPSAVFTITLSQPPTSPVTVDLQTVGASATEGVDYGGVTTSVTFAPGDTEETVMVVVFGDAVDEGDETFLLQVTSTDGAVTADGSGTGTILDDDTASLSIADAATTEGGVAVLAVTLSTPSSLTVTVSWTTADGTAAAGSDYVAASGVVTFLPGDVSESIAVSTLPDGASEGAETFRVLLSAPSGATIADGEATVTIGDVVAGAPEIPTLSTWMLLLLALALALAGTMLTRP